MDPIRALLELLRTHLPDSEGLEQQVRTLFDRFALVPRRDYEAHMEVVATLEAQVKVLEQRLAELETGGT